MKLRFYPVIFFILTLIPAWALAGFTQDTIKTALIAEFYLQEHDFNRAFAQYEKLAKTNDDENVLRRLFDISLIMGKLDIIEKSSKLIIKKKPDDIAANQNYLVALIGQNKFEQARIQIHRLHLAVKTQQGDLAKVFQKLALIKNKDGVASLLEGLLAKIKPDKEDWHALAVFYSVHSEYDQAISAVDKSIKLDSKWEDSNLLKARILYTRNLKGQAIEFIKTYYQKYNSNQAGVTYANMLIGNSDFPEAIRVYEKLIKSDDSPELIDALATLYANRKQYTKARRLFHKLQNIRGFKDKSNYYLGVIKKEQGELKFAQENFIKVGRGEYYLDSRLNVALILAKTDVATGIAYLDSLKIPDLKSHSMIITTKAEIYKENNQLDKAYVILTNAINEYYQSDLLYERALLAEKMGQIDSMEQDFLTILKNDPDNANALNALGYTLTEQTDRFLEALSYIEKALQLEPEQSYILDSMGWVQFKLGRIEEALKYLLRAYNKSNDPEIAAHISEVYLHNGDKSNALKFFKSGLKLDAKHPAVLKIMKLLQDKGIYH